MESPMIAPETATAITPEIGTEERDAKTPPSTTAISPGITNPKKRDASAHVSTNTAQSATDAGMEKKASMKRPISARLSALVEKGDRETHPVRNESSRAFRRGKPRFEGSRLARLELLELLARAGGQ